MEINIDILNVKEGDRSQVSLNCLAALYRSFETLKHLRLLEQLASCCFAKPHRFLEIRVMTLDHDSPNAFPSVNKPPKLAYIIMLFHQFDEAPDQTRLTFKKRRCSVVL